MKMFLRVNPSPGQHMDQRTCSTSKRVNSDKNSGFDHTRETKYPFAGSQMMGRMCSGCVAMFTMTLITR